MLYSLYSFTNHSVTSRKSFSLPGDTVMYFFWIHSLNFGKSSAGRLSSFDSGMKYCWWKYFFALPFFISMIRALVKSPDFERSTAPIAKQFLKSSRSNVSGFSICSLVNHAAALFCFMLKSLANTKTRVFLLVFASSTICRRNDHFFITPRPGFDLHQVFSSCHIS